MADNLGFDPGTAADVATDDVGGVHFQKVKLDGGGDGATQPIEGTTAYGLEVDVVRVQGVVSINDNSATVSVDDGGGDLSIDDGGNSITVDAPAGTPVAVRQSDGSSFISPALEHATAGSPLSARLSDGSSFYDAAKTGQLPGSLVSSRLDVNIGACPVTVSVDDASGSLTVDDGGTTLSIDDGGGAITVDGTVTANQGTAAAVGSGWPVKITDGTDTVGISTAAAAKALKVDVVQDVGQVAQTDKSAFTEGTTTLGVIGGVLNDTPVGDPSDNEASAARITAKRALHMNLRNNSGTEVGTAGAALRVDPVGTTAQPVTDNSGSLTVDDGGSSITVDGTVAATQSGAWTADITKFAGNVVVEADDGIPKVGLSDEDGADFSETNAIPVRCTNLEKTPVRKNVTYTASQTAVSVWDPTGGQKFVVESIIVSATGAGILKFYDNSDAAENMIAHWTLTVGDQVQITWPNGHPSSTADNILRYTSGSGAAGHFTVFGYEDD